MFFMKSIHQVFSIVAQGTGVICT